MTRRLLPAVFLLAWTAFAVAEPDAATLFAESCGACHGVDGKGAGPLSEGLGTDLPDLTTIAARNDGVFDRGRVVMLIDGRAGVAAHGGPMPLFSGLLTGPAASVLASDGSPVDTTEPIRALTLWLEGQQSETGRR